MQPPGQLTPVWAQAGCNKPSSRRTIQVTTSHHASIAALLVAATSGRGCCICMLSSANAAVATKLHRLDTLRNATSVFADNTAARTIPSPCMQVLRRHAWSTVHTGLLQEGCSHSDGAHQLADPPPILFHFHWFRHGSSTRSPDHLFQLCTRS